MIFNHEGGGISHLFKKGTNDDTFYSKNNFQYIVSNSNKINFVYIGDDFNQNIIKNIIEKNYGPKIIKFIKV